MSSGSFLASNEELTALAGRLEEIGATYGCPALSTAGTGAEVTGHVELGSVLPQFVDHTSEVINVLVGNLLQHAEHVRDAARLYCVADDGSAETLRSLSLPSFDSHANRP
ncbi:hypothetical protein ICW40_02880 [Actinotalea ferrariae]|uniref:hypothetical protein n=1 Tax=Actinotalea ferrariae TaxID=1386098 RepID=UPI001C8BD389|nr:hypothetical protein [Actinotalea ferrariae]MBX9243748.1 hypothetical protein [Actinotalea ferrariae]